MLRYGVAMLLTGVCMMMNACQTTNRPLAIQNQGETAGQSFVPLGVYWPWGRRTEANAELAGLDVWEYTDQLMAVLKNHHVNLLWVIHIPVDDLPTFCELASKHRLQVIASSNDIYSIGKHAGKNFHYDYIDSVVESIVNAWKDLDSLIGYVGFDEPFGQEMQLMNILKERFAAHDPSRPFIVVVRPHEFSFGMRVLENDLVAIDSYDFFRDPSPWLKPTTVENCQRRYANRLEVASYLTRTYDKTLWALPQAFSEPSRGGGFYYDPETGKFVVMAGNFVNWRMPTTAEIEWQGWTALSKGIKGIVYFVLLPGAPLEKDEFFATKGKDFQPSHPRANVDEPFTMEATALVKRGLEMSPQFVAMGDLYERLTPHLELLANSKPACPVAYTQSPVSAVTFSKPGGGAEKYFVIVHNNDVGKPAKEDILLLPSVASATDVVAGKEMELHDRDGMRSFEISLAPGQGTIIQLRLSDTFACYNFQVYDFTGQLPNTPRSTLANLILSKVVEGTNLTGGILEHHSRLVKDDTDQAAHLAWGFSYPPNLIEPARLYMYLQGSGSFTVAFADEDGKEISAIQWANKPVLIPYAARGVTIHFDSRDAALTKVYTVYSKAP